MDIWQQEQKEIYISEYRNNIKREGATEILNWLEETDFFEAPASANHHGNYPGGLAAHATNVYYRLREKAEIEKLWEEEKEESIAITALLHDVCKANFYKKKGINVTGKGVSYFYEYDNQFPAGHGEKSVILIQRYMQLTTEEIMAINWHMGGFDTRSKTRDLSIAWERYPLAILLHLADMEATWIDERRRICS